MRGDVQTTCHPGKVNPVSLLALIDGTGSAENISRREFIKHQSKSCRTSRLFATDNRAVLRAGDWTRSSGRDGWIEGQKVEFCTVEAKPKRKKN